MKEKFAYTSSRWNRSKMNLTRKIYIRSKNHKIIRRNLKRRINKRRSDYNRSRRNKISRECKKEYEL